MTARDFCYWLQGKLEIDGKPQALTPEQVGVIAKHLALVFKHEIDPSYGDEKHQKVLNEIHNPTCEQSSDQKSGVEMLKELEKKLDEKLKELNKYPRPPGGTLMRC